MKHFTKLFGTIASFLFVFSATSVAVTKTHKEESHYIVDEQFVDEQGFLTEPIDVATHTEDKAPQGKYRDGVVLVRSFHEVDTEELDLDIESVEELYPNSPWKTITLGSGTSFDAVKYLRSTGKFDKVDYDYIMGSDADVEPIDVSSNPYYEELPYIQSNGVGHAWGHIHNEGQNEGGSSDVVVAIIDTGIDYHHHDLHDNIWVNPGEIPNNHKDDDNNGYIDDMYGWDFVHNDSNPMDDNGHGTFVAGIVAAENNDQGTVGVAFDCKVMALKAGDCFGYFTNTDIAKAITYAYMNGASVINMSFGGSSISMAVEDALQAAYESCVMVAAAGNDSLCNEPGCPNCHMFVRTYYPACLNTVIGVMSCNAEGTMISPFSNYDHHAYNQYEYDIYACGEQITSTWPSQKYVKLSGTSASSPVVAGMAALLRSSYPDRDAFTNDDIRSQIVNSGAATVHNRFGLDLDHKVANAYEAFVDIPEPIVNSLYRWYAFDNMSYSSKNNNDGFIDAGETVKLGIELQNRGGKAKNVAATISTELEEDPTQPDPYVTIQTDTVNYGDIGTYSCKDGTKVYDGDTVVDMEKGFMIKAANNTPNGHECKINVHVEYQDAKGVHEETFVCDFSFTISISAGYRISGTITEDTVFTADKEYIISDTVTIPEGVTVEFTEGCKISFYSNDAGYIDILYNSPSIKVFGNLIFSGVENKEIHIQPVENFSRYVGFIYGYQNGKIELNYCVTENIAYAASSSISHIFFNYCKLSLNGNYNGYSSNPSYYTDGNVYGVYCLISCNSNCGELKNCILDTTSTFSYETSIYLKTIRDCVLFVEKNSSSIGASEYFNNLFVYKYLGNNSYGTIEKYAIYNNYSLHEEVVNNAFILASNVTRIRDLKPISFDYETYDYYQYYSSGNVFPSIYLQYKDDIVKNNKLPSGEDYVNLNDVENHDDSVIWPYIKDISIYDKNNQQVRTVGTEKNTVRVTFSRALDISKKFSLFYGAYEPYNTYEIKGNYVSDTVWEGELQVKARSEGGIQFFSSQGGVAKNDSFKELIHNSNYFTFDIDTSSAFAMNLQAFNTDAGVELNWVQDDYDTLMGYNIYRSESKDGNFTRINSSVIPADESTFIDDSYEPGKTYWYTFTVVLTDFSESAPAGKVSINTRDTVLPTIYHTPVNQWYAGNNLVITCTASDNVGIASGTLYYRTFGETEWKSVAMGKNNNRLSATIFGNEITLTGLEYYIAVSDGTNIITRGSADSPFNVLVKDPSTLSKKGDVDGDGTITTKDALMLMQCINGDILLSDDAFQRADLNSDGELNSVEALRILQYINGNVNTLEM